MQGRRDLALVLLLMAAVLVPRLAVFGVNENYYGDSVMRAELGGRWAAKPRIIGSFKQGAYQFGPLHIMLLGVLTKAGGTRADIGRWLSLFAGVLSVWPLFWLTRRLFDRTAAIVACLGLALWGMHIQFSTTAASEALSMLLVFATLALFARAVLDEHRPSLLWAALVFNLACATRYDVWLWAPLLCGVLVLRKRVGWAVLFGALACAFPVPWSLGNWADTGDLLYPFRYIDDYHRRWFEDGVKVWGDTSYRLQNLVFWPATALATLSPLVGAAGMIGLVRAWREKRETRWLIALILIPTAMFTFRSTVTSSFVPLARFAVKEVGLLLPFVWFGFQWAPLQRVRKPLLAVAAALAVAVPLGLALYTVHREGKWEDTVRPLSPVTTNPVGLMQVARYLADEVNAKGEAVILDSDAGYRDIQIAFFSGLPEERLARHRWEIFPQRLAQAQPRFLVRIDGGTLAAITRVDGKTAQLGEWQFTEVDGFAPPFHVYRR